MLMRLGIMTEGAQTKSLGPSCARSLFLWQAQPGCCRRVGVYSMQACCQCL